MGKKWVEILNILRFENCGQDSNFGEQMTLEPKRYECDRGIN